MPNWLVRIYCDGSVPGDAIEMMIQLGAKLVRRDPPKPATAGLFWRFEPIEDVGLDRVLIRDADCRLGGREAAAVEEWVTSGRAFHIMRDHPCNNELILAGLWGAICGTLDGFSLATASYRSPIRNRWTDQSFLRNEVWPIIKDHALIHDSCFDLFGARPFPPHAPSESA